MASAPPTLPYMMQMDATGHMTTPIEPTVTGTVPPWLSGSLFGNGTGIMKVGDMTWHHWFDGFSVLHRWSIHEGKVSYQASILDSDHYKKCVKADRLIGIGFGSNFQDPGKSLFKRTMSHVIPGAPDVTDNTNVNIIEHGERLLALTETPIINEVTPDALSIAKTHNIASRLNVHMGNAHPLTERDGSCMYYFGINMNYKQAYNFVKIPLNGNEEDPFANAEVIARIESRWKLNIGFTHSFGMTENYFVHIENPVTLNLPKMMTMTMKGQSIGTMIKIQKEETMHFIVIDKKTGDRWPVKYFAPHGFVLHFVNCYEEDGHIVVDVAQFEDGKVIKSAFVESMNNIICGAEGAHSIEAQYARYILPLDVSDAVEGQNIVSLNDAVAQASLRKGTKKTVDLVKDSMFDAPFEMPQINKQFAFIKNRYAYGVRTSVPTGQRLIKFDLQERTILAWDSESTHMPSEPVFVPRPGATTEDDGVVLSQVVSNTPGHASYLIILDGVNFTEICRATTPADYNMSFVFHSLWSNKHTCF